jgi:hypothetical protein
MLVEILKAVLSALRSIFRSRAALLAEDVVLRQQMIVLHRSVPKPRFRARDRVVLALAARVFASVLKAITIVRPETVVRWHHSFWRLLWRRKSGRPAGRPPADVDYGSRFAGDGRKTRSGVKTESPASFASLATRCRREPSPSTDHRTSRAIVASPGPHSHFDLRIRNGLREHRCQK